MNKFHGMTLNERLYVGELMDCFDKAVANRNIEKIISILKHVDLSDDSIRPILESLGLKKTHTDNPF